MSESPFFTVPEIAALLRQPVSWVYEQSRMGVIPHYKGGKRLLFDRDEVLAWFRDTYRRGIPLPSYGRPLRVPAGRRRGVSNRRLGRPRAERPTATRVSANGRRAVAVPLPAGSTAAPE